MTFTAVGTPVITQSIIDGLNIQLEEGTTATSYEPFVKHEILVDNEKYTDTLNVGTSLDNRSRVNILKSKNLLKYPYQNTTKTINGITFTDNKDGTITINGTATANCSFSLLGNYTNEKLEGDYIYGGINGNIVVQVIYHNNSVGYVALARSEGTSVKINKNKYNTGYIELRVSSGTVCNNVLITPMMTKEENNTYEPYATPSINVDGEEIYSKPVVLYESTGKNGAGDTSIVLNDNVSNYEYIEVLYDRYGYQKSMKFRPTVVTSSDVISFIIDISMYSSNLLRIYSSSYRIDNDNTFTLIDRTFWNTTYTAPTTTQDNQLRINKVLGYK
jgi:hypothetical protein